MALIECGSFDQFSARFQQSAIDKRGKALGNAEHLKRLCTLYQFREASRPVQSIPLMFDESKAKCGLSLKSIKLSEEFGGFFGHILNKNHKIYFLAWAWDFSGNPPVLYPASGVPLDQIMIPLKSGKLREFIGEGIVLFPAKKVSGGLALRMNLWESDKDLREMGKTLVEVSDTIQQSKLTNLLTLGALVGGVPFVTAEMIKAASLELASAIGLILKANSDDYVDFFEGYYPASCEWIPEEEHYEGLGCEIAVRKFV